MSLNDAELEALRLAQQKMSHELSEAQRALARAEEIIDCLLTCIRVRQRANVPSEIV